MQNYIVNFSKHDSRAVANFFILKSQNETRATEFKLTATVLEKVVYLAHAFHVYCFNRSLCDQEPLIGSYEPYFAELREALKYTENLEIPHLISEGDPFEQYFFKGKSNEEVVSTDFIAQQIKLLDVFWDLMIVNNIQCHNLSYFSKNFEYFNEQNSSKHTDQVAAVNKEIAKSYIENAIHYEAA